MWIALINPKNQIINSDMLTDIRIDSTGRFQFVQYYSGEHMIGRECFTHYEDAENRVEDLRIAMNASNQYRTWYGPTV